MYVCRVLPTNILSKISLHLRGMKRLEIAIVLHCKISILKASIVSNKEGEFNGFNIIGNTLILNLINLGGTFLYYECH